MADNTEYRVPWDEEDDLDSALNNSDQGGEGVNNSSNSYLPLGLRLNPTPSFINSLQIASDEQPAVPEKVKAGNFTAASIKIGNWQMISKHEGDLTAKLYYAKQKLVWEMLMETKHEGELKLKRKIEMQWSDICGIRATMHPNQPGILEIELSQPPSFSQEVNPQPRKHTLWKLSSDFTWGEAPVWRRHIVIFRPGILDKHYEQLLQCNKRLFDMSRRPFPSHQSPYFDDPNLFGINSAAGMSTLSFSRPYASSTSSQFPYYQSYNNNPAPQVPPLTLPSSPDLSTMIEGIYDDNQPQMTIWDNIPQYDDQEYYYQAAPNVGLPIENNNVHSSNPPLMGSLPEPTDVINPSFNYVNSSFEGYQFPYAAAASQMMQNHESNSAPAVTDGFYSQQHANWNVPPQHNSDSQQTSWNVPHQHNSDSQQTNWNVQPQHNSVIQQTNSNVPPKHNSDSQQTNWNVQPQHNSVIQQTNSNVPPQHNSDNNVVNYQGSSSLPPHYYSGYNPNGHGNLF